MKISPEDTPHKYLQLKVSSTFYYAMSAAIGAASWEITYSLVNLEQSDPWQLAQSWYEHSDSVGWGGVKNYKQYSTPSEYFWLYQYLGFVTQDAYIFSPDEWYYVGVHLILTLSGQSDFYRFSLQLGSSYFDISGISWKFTTFYEDTNP